VLTFDVIDSRALAAYYKVTVMHELRRYLELLLDHQCSTAKGKCPECLGLQRLYEFMQTELFSCVIYTGTPLETRQPARSTAAPVNRAGAGPRPPRAA